MEQMIVIAALIVVGLFIGIKWVKTSKLPKHKSTGTGGPYIPSEQPEEIPVEDPVEEQTN